jgi:serine protease
MQAFHPKPRSLLMKSPKTRNRFVLILLAVSLLLTNSIGVALAQSDQVFLPLTSAEGGEAPAEAAAKTIGTDQLIIHYKKAAQATMQNQVMQTASLSQAAGVALTYVHQLADQSVVVKLPQHLTDAELKPILARIQLPEVAVVEPDVRVYPQRTPNDPRYNDQWHYFAPTNGNYGANLPAAWDITTGVASVVVAVLDTGQLNHADLQGRMVAGYDFITDSSTAGDGNGSDSSWHGTHVAGTIGAKSNNGVGVAGVNWTSMIQHVRVLGKCGGNISDIADAIRWAAGLSVSGTPLNATPAKVLNLSLGGSGPCGTTIQSAINAAVNAGSVVVVAAGNSSLDASNFQPANCNNVITVAATDRDGDRADYSNFGAMVEIAAPGGETDFFSSSNGVLSTLNTGTTTPATDSYVFYQGTSMATPHVAGLVSLMLSVQPALTPAQVLSLLQSSVTPFPAGSSCTTSSCGRGIINAAAAVAAAQGGLLAPSNLQATAASATQINLTWQDNSSDETGFKIERCQGANCTNFAQLATVGANVTTYNNTGVAANTSYSYRVRGLKNGTESAPSNVATISTGGAGCSVLSSSDVPKAIEDHSTAQSTLTVANGLTINDLNVRNLNINHTYVADLTARLISPAGTQVELFGGIGSSGDNFSNTTLDDEASTPIANANPPYSGSFRPSGALSSFDGQNAAGVWTLQISDNGFLDTGTLTGWSLELCGSGNGGGGDVIFEDGFESSNFSAWSSTSTLDGGDLSVSAAAALVGTRGMSIFFDDVVKLYVTDDSPNAEARYRARFKFDPNSLTLPNKLAHFIFYGYKGSSTLVLRLEFRLYNGAYQLRSALRNDASTWKNSAWYNISDAPHSLELDWRAATGAGANNGSLTFWIDGVQKGTVTGVDNDSHRIDRIRLGAINGLDSGTRGSYFFDAFKSTRSSYIGPVAQGANAVDAAQTAEQATDPAANVVEDDLSLDDVGEVVEDDEVEAIHMLYLPVITQ